VAAKALLKDLNAKHGLATVLLEFFICSLGVITGSLERVLTFGKLGILVVEPFLG